MRAPLLFVHVPHLRETRYKAVAWTAATTPVRGELAWSGELLNRAPAWGGNWLRRARGGRWISELHSSYPAGSAGHPAGLDAE